MFLLPDLPTAFWPLAAACVLLIGVSKAGFAGGVGLLALPALILVLPPRQVVALLLPILCVCDWFSLAAYRRHFSKPDLVRLLPPAVLGIAAGSLVLGNVPPSMLKVGIGVLSLAFVVCQIYRGRLETIAWQPPPWVTSIFGISAGFVSTLAHSAGPIISMYLLPRKLDRSMYVGTSVAFFTIVNAVKLAPYGILGLLPTSNLAISILLLPFIPVGVGLGVWANRRLSPKWFLRIVYTLLTLTAIHLITGWTPWDLVRRS